MAQAAKRTPRPADMPQILPHLSEANAAELHANRAKTERKRFRRYRTPLWASFSVLLIALVTTAWIVHLNFGFTLNKHAEYREPVRVLDLTVWHQGNEREFVGSVDVDGRWKTGVVRRWDEEGMLVSESHFENYSIVGTWRTWRAGELATEMQWSGSVSQ